MKKLIFVTAAAAVALTGVAIAQSAPPAPPAGHDMTRAQVQAMVREHFSRFDTDKDGAISTAEIGQIKGPLGDHGGPQVMMLHGGPGGDPAAAFDRLDSNKDGAISRDEFTKGREIRIEKRMVMKDGKQVAVAPGQPLGGNVFIHRVERGGKMGHHGGGRMIVMADNNHDGRITLAEAEAMALQHFDKMDANHDGRITPDERRDGRQIIIKEIREKRTEG